MNILKSLFAASLFAALVGGVGCNNTSDNTDDGKAISGVEVSPNNATLAKGSTIQLHAIVTYGDGTTKDVTDSGDTVWNTSDPDIATVSDDGLVTGVKEGVVDISANYKGEKANDHFAVTP